MTTAPPAAAAVRFGSCDAERRWRPSGLAQLPALRDPRSEQLLRGMDELQAVLCGPDDVLLTHRRPAAVFGEMMRAAGFGARHLVVPGDPGLPVEDRLAADGPRGLEGLAGLEDLEGLAAEPYAVLPGTAAAVERLGLLGAALPELEAVRTVNSKTWSTRLGLPGSGQVVTSLDGLRQAAGDRCVVKDPYGVSGQGNIVVDSPTRLAMVERALGRCPEDRIELVVQPLFEPAADFAAHLTVGPDGEVVWHGIRQIVNEGHAYRGSTAPEPGLLRQLDRASYRECVEGVARAAAEEGYRGPLSVDSMTTTAGELIPVLEVNARLSPGLIAQRLGVRLRLASVRVGAEDCFDRLVDRLDRTDRLATGGRDGILPLAASTLAPPRGWLFYAVFGEADPELGEITELLAAQ
ncbi:hypothetical protein [Streptacidiphilus cavernicola]|uniref:ATP-grasp domain-containing protein n=1 Tax=Streptacidiphilus cavernicola TaxID=3342716 RepID=A0ABV6W1B4_9ACTN